MSGKGSNSVSMAPKLESGTHAAVIELPEHRQQVLGEERLMAGNARVFDKVQVAVDVIVGQAHTTIGELMNLKVASVLKIERLVHEDIEVLIDGNVVARGQLVAVDDHFGIRVTEIAKVAQA